MAALLIDNSNTRTKFALMRNGSLLPETRVLPTASICPQAVRSLVADWKVDRVCICSVVPDAAEVLAGCFSCPVARVCAGMAHSLLAGYPDAATLGADRIANVLAVAGLDRFPAVAVDLGTAVTFDVVVEGPRFAGGVISPGLRMLADALHERTRQLPAVDAHAPVLRVVGLSTVQAMQSGVRLAFCGMVRETLQALAEELGARPYVVATGGDAALAASVCSEIDAVDERLTLKGIALAAQL